MVETIVYEIWVAGRFGEIIHHRKLSFEKVLTRVNLACINLPVVNIHLESDRDAGRAPPFRSAYRTRRSLLFLRFFNDSLTREAGGATRPTPLAHCRPAHSPDVALNLFIRKANGLCSTPLACHLATLLRAIRSTDKERRSIERRSCIKNLALRLGCIGALHPSAVLGLSASAAMKNLRSDRDWVLCPIVIWAPLTSGVGVRFLTACGIELAIRHAARHGQFLFNRAWGRRLHSRMGRGFQPQYMLHVQMTFGVSRLNCAGALCPNHTS